MKSHAFLTMVFLALFLVSTAAVSAQMPEGGPPDMPPHMGPGGPGMGPGGPGMGPGGPGMGSGFGRRGGKGPQDPAEKARREKMGALKTTAEAYKNLADMYREQGKVDEAVAQLKKILDLSTGVDLKETPAIANQLGHVYMEIAECYMSKERFADAEGILSEGFEKVKGLNPDIASRMMLFLGNAYRKAGKVPEAEKAFKRVIDLNAAAVNAK